MIKPASYWALHKNADPVTLGRIGLAIAGRGDELDPPLNAAETALASVIQQDSEWMDERAAEKRERWRQRQHDKRERDKKESRNVTVTSRDEGGTKKVTAPSIHPSIHPSVHPEEEDSSSASPPTPPGGMEPPKRSGFHPPTIEEVVEFAANPAKHTGGAWDEAWARDWYRRMAELDPPWADSRGRTIVSWQRRMVNDWRISEERKRKPDAAANNGGRRYGNSNQPVGVVHQEDDYENPFEHD